jgi:hypothetical protein
MSPEQCRARSPLPAGHGYCRRAYSPHLLQISPIIPSSPQATPSLPVGVKQRAEPREEEKRETSTSREVELVGSGCCRSDMIWATVPRLSLDFLEALLSAQSMADWSPESDRRWTDPTQA